MSYIPEDYVPVHTRVQQFHEKYPNWCINTESEMIWDKTVKFLARVVLDVTSDHLRQFSWQSFCNIIKDKAFEKWETVAVWRALAFAWFEIQSWIASQDEMNKFMTSEQMSDVLADEEKQWFSETQLQDIKNNFDELKTKYPKGVDLVRNARHKYKVSRAFAKKIEELYN